MQTVLLHFNEMLYHPYSDPVCFPINVAATAPAAAAGNAEQIASLKPTTTAAAAEPGFISPWSYALGGVCTGPVPSTTTSLIVSITA
jgi:hypothetical protein